jgi:tRNA threonylcarbamoyladenosine biosynthesis protein TsaE
VSATIELETRAADETRKVGAALAELLGPGDVVSLTGDLGAGKTAFVQGAARALGVTGPVTSPTFVLVREYRGEVSVRHVDVYRLQRFQEVLDLGFEDLVDAGGVAFIEWGDVVDALLPDSHVRVEIRAGDHDDHRSIGVTPRGPTWAGRRERMEATLAPWRSV